MHPKPHPSSDDLPLAFNWSRLKKEHFVQFYHDDRAFADTVGSFVAHGLKDSNAAIVISTRSHRVLIESWLRSKGLDVEGLECSGRYIPLDAEETLAKFMVDGEPDGEKFFQVIGPLLSRTINRWNGLWAFGEMVALLWARDNKPAAIELERLWNKLAELYPFALFCAYPKSPIDSLEEQDALLHICAAHSTCIM